MRSHPERIFFVLGAAHSIVHPQSSQPTLQHQKPATKR